MGVYFMAGIVDEEHSLFGLITEDGKRDAKIGGARILVVVNGCCPARTCAQHLQAFSPKDSRCYLSADASLKRLSRIWARPGSKTENKRGLELRLDAIK
jgi:hypothetical protein